MKLRAEIGSLNKYPFIKYKEYKTRAYLLEGCNATAIIWNVNNSLNCKLNNQEVLVSPNSIILLDKGHSVSFKGNDISEIKVLKFNSNIFSSSIVFACGFINTMSNRNYKNKTILSFKKKQIPFIEKTFKSIEETLKNSYAIDIDRLKSMITELLYNSLKENFKNDASYVNPFGKILNVQYNIHHNVSDYALQLNMKPKNLLRKFQKEGLKNPSEIIKEKLLLEIKEKLIYTNKSIREICFEIGFYDPAYFSRFFKKHVGITAQYFRKQYTTDSILVEMENSAIQ